MLVAFYCMKKLFFLLFLCISILAISVFKVYALERACVGNFCQEKEDNLEGVLRIVNFLEEAANFSRESGRFQGRVAVFSEDEVSAFFEYLISEGTDSLKSLKLKILSENRVEGWVVLDLKSQGISGQPNLFFSARIEQNSRKVRLNFQSLFLETQRIQPAVLNAMIDIIAAARGLETWHPDDWFDLPEGIARVETEKGKLLVHY